MTNTVAQSTANNIDVIEGQFYRALGDGKKAGKYLQELILSVVKSRDTTVLVRAIHRADSKKDDAQATSALRTVIREVWPGVKMTKDANGRPAIKISGIAADEEALLRLKDAVNRDLSIRNAAFRKAVSAPVKEEKVFDPMVTAERFAKKHDLSEVRSMIAALQAQEKALAAEKAAEEQLSKNSGKKAEVVEEDAE